MYVIKWEKKTLKLTLTQCRLYWVSCGHWVIRGAHFSLVSDLQLVCFLYTTEPDCDWHGESTDKETMCQTAQINYRKAYI